MFSPSFLSTSPLYSVARCSCLASLARYFCTRLRSATACWSSCPVDGIVGTARAAGIGSGQANAISSSLA
eukprot:865127-Pyramimonas_sp.AAC.1